MSEQQIPAVEAYFLALQERLCSELEDEDGGGKAFATDSWQRDEGGGGRSRVLRDGLVFEAAGVNFSHVRGENLPSAASRLRPELAGRPFQALGVSLVIHPSNPYVPTAHCNVRYFQADGAQEHGAQMWWFGGGFDLTPYYGFDDDAIHWHESAAAACADHGADTYARLKRRCDEYFYLPHRSEARALAGCFLMTSGKADSSIASLSRAAWATISCRPTGPSWRAARISNTASANGSFSSTGAAATWSST